MGCSYFRQQVALSIIIHLVCVFRRLKKDYTASNYFETVRGRSQFSVGCLETTKVPGPVSQHSFSDRISVTRHARIIIAQPGPTQVSTDYILYMTPFLFLSGLLSQ